MLFFIQKKKFFYLKILIILKFHEKIRETI